MGIGIEISYAILKTMFFEVILLFLIIFLLLILSMIWPPDSPWAPWWQAGIHEIRQSLKLAKVTEKDTVYDLGSGDGRVLIVAAREFGAKGVGIEIDPLRFIIAKIRIKLAGLSNFIEIKRGNFFDQDLSKASVIFVYLIPKTLNLLLPKLKKELKKGTRIVSYKYEMDLPLIKYDRESLLRMYKI